MSTALIPTRAKSRFPAAVPAPAAGTPPTDRTAELTKTNLPPSFVSTVRSLGPSLSLRALSLRTCLFYTLLPQTVLWSGKRRVQNKWTGIAAKEKDRESLLFV